MVVHTLLIPIKYLVDLQNFLVELRFCHNVCHDVFEFVEVDLFVLSALVVPLQDILHVLVCRFLAKAPEQVLELRGGDSAVAVLVEELKSFLKVGFLSLIKLDGALFLHVRGGHYSINLFP